MKDQSERKTTKQTPALERGVEMDVFGRAIIAQADERIQWHKRTATRMESELKAMAESAESVSIWPSTASASRETIWSFPPRT